ncbi:hypothetical protein F5Y03DRAFT_406887 [Xylaria venustula]|nr:hypothetical protein F5Y03DRAFT_406887 [Xylaria venustula]
MSSRQPYRGMVTNIITDEPETLPHSPTQPLVPPDSPWTTNFEADIVLPPSVFHNEPWFRDAPVGYTPPPRPIGYPGEYSSSSPLRQCISDETLQRTPKHTQPSRPRASTDFDQTQRGNYTPSSPPRTSSLKRAAIALRKVLSFRSSAQRLAAKREKEAAEAQTAATIAARQSQLRRTAIRNGSITWDELYELAALEGVHLNPRASRRDRFNGDDYGLASGLVARVSGREEGHTFVFLGEDRFLYVGCHHLGRGARQVSRTAEGPYSQFRATARAYYQLCR